MASMHRSSGAGLPLAALLLLAGCHWVFPFGQQGAGDGPLGPLDGDGPAQIADGPQPGDLPPPDAAKVVIPVHAWSKGFGGPESDFGYAVAVDSAGNGYLAGIIEGPVNLGGGALSGSGAAHDVFIASYGPDGQHRWSKRFGSQYDDYAHDLAVDPAGNSVLTGFFWESVSFGGPSLPAAGADIYLAAYNAAGDHRWSKRFGGALTDYGYGVALDKAGNAFVTGFFGFTTDFGGGTVSSVASSNDIFLASYGPTGEHRWSNTLGSPGTDVGYSVAVDAQGNTYLAGTFTGTVDLGGGPLTGSGIVDIYLASYGPTGGHRWSKPLGGTDYDTVTCVTVGPAGNVYLTGAFTKTASFGGPPLASAGSNDIYLASFDQAGAHRWSKRFGSPAMDGAASVATDAGGNVYLTGYFQGTADFGGGPLTSAGNADTILASFAPDGTHRWSMGFGDASFDQGTDVAVHSDGSLHLTGTFMGTVSFGGPPLTGNGKNDIFLVKLAPP